MRESDRMARILAVFLLLGALTACQVLGGSGSTSSTSTNPVGDNDPIQWDRDPYAVVFRAEVVGGFDASAIYAKNRIPYCTIYGDGHVIWTVDNSEIIIDQLDDRVIRDFISYLTIQERIYTYRAPSELAISAVPPVVEMLTVHVNDVVHTTDSLASWPDGYFSRILSACQQLGRTPSIYEPQGAWLTVQETIYDPTIPTQLWDEEATGINLSELANSGQAIWVTGVNARALWSYIRSNSPDIQLSTSLADYHYALEVPGVTKDAPLPP